MTVPAAGTGHGSRFLGAFNDIEDHFRKSLGVDAHVEFAELARRYSDRNRLTREQHSALSAFAALRNAISHSRYFDGRPIADPVEAVVTQIERLRDQILAPPLALTVLGSMEVVVLAPDDAVGMALTLVREHDYSQFPIYSAGTYVGLLTTNAVARWLADQLLSNGGIAESEDIAHVMKFDEPHEVAVLVPRSITVTQALHLLSQVGGGRPPTALLVTHSGHSSEKPLGLIVTDDLPVLVDAIALR